MRPYTVVGSERHRIGRFDVCQDTLLIDQKKYPYSYTRMKESVAIIPINEDTQVMGLVYQYRHSIDSWVYEAAAGAIEKGETTEAAAIRELKEETGFVVEPENLIALGAVYPVAGISNEKMHLFVGRGFMQTEPQSEPTEFVKPYIMTVADFEKRILDGTFSNMYGIALWYKYLLYKKKQDWDLGGA